jgi:hypothetical protein
MAPGGAETVDLSRPRRQHLPILFLPSHRLLRAVEPLRVIRLQLARDLRMLRQHVNFPQPKPSGRIVAVFKGVSKSYGPKHVF